MQRNVVMTGTAEVDSAALAIKCKCMVQITQRTDLEISSMRIARVIASSLIMPAVDKTRVRHHQCITYHVLERFQQH